MSSSSINIHAKPKIENNNNTRERYSPREIFNKYLTIEEIRKHPEITPAIKGDKKFRLDILSRQKLKVINIKGIQNQNRIKFISSLNSFHKLFFDSYKNNINSKEEIDILNQENKDFSKKYQNSKINKNMDKFNDIKSEYEKRNYYVSPIEGKKNLFNGNILLSNRQDLKNYILYNLGTPISNCKSLSFLHKINKTLGDKTSEKELRAINAKIDMLSLGMDKIEKDEKNEIKKNINDISQVKETIKGIDDMKSFYNLDARQYLDSLKEEDSRGTSAKFSTRVNSALNCLDNVKYQNNINNYIIKNKLFDNKKDNKKKLNKKMSPINRNSHLYNLITETDETKTENDKNIKQQHRYYNKAHVKTMENNDLSKSPLEKLYENLSKKDDLLNYQNDIKKYLLNKKYDVSVKINPTTICNNLENVREKIYKSDFLKNDYQLRKQIGENLKITGKNNNDDLKIKNKINNIEDKVIKLFCDINNPRKKEE